MAYGVKYRFDFDDKLSQSHRIDIEKDGYSGSITEFNRMGEEPIIISIPGGSGKFQSVLGSEAVLSLIATSSLQYSEFISAKNKDYKVKHYLDVSSVWTIQWTGYVMPDMYFEPFKSPPYEFQLRATDMLGDLQSIYFGSAVDTPYTGRDDQLDIIVKILDKIGLGLDIYSYLNIFELTHNETSSDDPLPQTYVNQEHYRKDFEEPGNCYDVLKSILDSYGAKIIQAEGAWRILLIHDQVSSSYTYRKYNSSGTYQSNGSVSPRKAVTAPTVSGATIVAWQDADQVIEVIPAYKSFKVVQDYGRRKNMVWNPEFKDKYWSDANQPMKWTKSTTGTWIKRLADRVFLYYDAPDLASAKYIYQVPLSGFAKLITTGSCTLRVRLKNTSHQSGNDGTREAQIKLDDGTNQRYLTGPGAWQVASTTIGTSGPSDMEIETDAIPLTDTDLTVTLYENIWTGAGIRSILWHVVEIEIMLANGDAFPDNKIYDVSIDVDYNVVPADYEITLGDFPGLDNEECVYMGCLVDSSGDALSTWHHKGLTDHYNLIQHLADDIKDNYDQPTFKLSGTLYSKILGFDKVLQASIGGSNHYFIPSMLSYNVKRATWQGEWLEVL